MHIDEGLGEMPMPHTQHKLTTTNTRNTCQETGTDATRRPASRSHSTHIVGMVDPAMGSSVSSNNMAAGDTARSALLGRYENGKGTSTAFS